MVRINNTLHAVIVDGFHIGDAEELRRLSSKAEDTKQGTRVD